VVDESSQEPGKSIGGDDGGGRELELGCLASSIMSILSFESTFDMTYMVSWTTPRVR